MAGNLKSSKGHFLVSNTVIQDPHFTQTVVLLIDHDEKGAFGLVLNRPLDLTLYDIVAGLPERGRLIKLYKGGPVQPDTLFVLHNEAGISIPGEQVIPGVFLGSNSTVLAALLEKSLPFQAYLGYAGWGPGQLESELAENAWLVVKARSEMIFHAQPEKVWRQALSDQGGIFSYFAKNIRDPLLN